MNIYGGSIASNIDWLIREKCDIWSIQIFTIYRLLGQVTINSTCIYVIANDDLLTSTFVRFHTWITSHERRTMHVCQMPRYVEPVIRSEVKWMLRFWSDFDGEVNFKLQRLKCYGDSNQQNNRVQIGSRQVSGQAKMVEAIQKHEKIFERHFRALNNVQ